MKVHLGLSHLRKEGRDILNKNQQNLFYKNGPHNDLQLFEAFIEANPTIRNVPHSARAQCLSGQLGGFRHTITQRSPYPCTDENCVKLGLGAQPIDHGRLAMFPGRRCFVIAHNYGKMIDAYNCKLSTLGLTWVDLGAARSWYNPGSTRLVLIGTPDTLALVNTD